MNASTDKSADKHADKATGKPTDKHAGKHADKPDQPQEITHPKPAGHSDDERSRMPERGDKSRDQSPADRPGKKPGEGEPSVG